MKVMFFSICLIIYLTGAFFVITLLATNRLKLIDDNTGNEIKIPFHLKLFVIIVWPMTIILIFDSFRKGD